MSDAVSTSAAARPRLLMVGRLYPPTRGSGGRLMRELARSFARDGWDVQVLTTDSITSDDPDGSVKVLRLFHRFHTPSVMAGLVLLWRFFWVMMFLRRPQVIITLSDPPLLVVIGQMVARLRRVPHIHWCHDVYPDLLPVIGVRVPGLLYRLMMRASRWGMNGAARVVVTGRCMARYLSQHGVVSDHITLIPNWPELAMNPHIKTGSIPEPSHPMPIIQTTSSFHDPIPKFRVLYVGTVGYAHPIDTILDAATILESLHPEIEFIFIGDEVAHRIVNAEKARRGGLENVRVLPFQPMVRLRDIMESGDIHLLSLRQDAAGLTVPAKFYAALAAARPCLLVGPEATEIGRIIQDYKIGAVIPQKSAQILAQTIIDYRLREDLWFIAHDGAMKAVAAYTPEDMIRLWLRKARELLRAV